MGILDIPTNQMDTKDMSIQNYPRFRELYKVGVNNNWVPEEVAMNDDREQWNTPGKLSEQEKNLVMMNLGLFSTAEALTQDNIIISLFPYVQDAYARQAMMRWAYEEAIHTDTFLYVIDSLSLNIHDVYKAYDNVPTIKEKDEFLLFLVNEINELDTLDLTKTEDIRILFRNLFGYVAILEGLSFYGNFAQVLSLGRQNKMKGLAKQIEFILRDESNHIAIGFELMNIIKREYPQIWTAEFQNELISYIEKAVELEQQYNHASIPQGLFGLRPEDFDQYIQYIADRRLEALGLSGIYNVESPFPWLTTMQDTLTESNFFESRDTNYQVGALNMDEDF